jgi:hypothetical protein
MGPWVLIVSALAATTVQVAGQGQGAYATFFFNNFALSSEGSRAVDASVFDWAGNLLTGADWRAELYGGAASDSMSPVINYRGGAREIIGFWRPGYFASGEAFLCVLSVPAYGTAWLQVKVWDVGLAVTYEEAVARGVGGYGQSALFQAQGGNTQDALGLPPPLIGLQSFSVLKEVPEPSVRGLLLLGIGGFAWRAHRQRVPLPTQE